ncbi:O-methyltransferase-domain-containing protein [Scleroderma yunnanense]
MGHAIVPQETRDYFVQVEEYQNSFLIRPDDGLEGALKHCEENGLPKISVSAAQGKLLKLLALSIGAKRILEIGTLGGYSTIWMAQALPDDGELIALEISEKHAKIARENIDTARVRNVKVVVGDANEILASLTPEKPFDFIFVDANKESYPNYFREAKRLVRKQGVIVIDNIVWNGEVADLTHTDPEIEGIRATLAELKADKEVEATTISMVGEKGYDGFVYAVKL